MRYFRTEWDAFKCPIIVKDENSSILVGFPTALKTWPSLTGKSGAMLVAHKYGEHVTSAIRVDTANIGTLPCWLFPRILKGYEVENLDSLFFVSLYPRDGLEEVVINPPFWANVQPVPFYVKGNKSESHLLPLAWKKWKKYLYEPRFYRHGVPVKNEILTNPVFPFFKVRCADGGAAIAHLSGSWEYGVIDFLDSHFQINATEIITKKDFNPYIQIGKETFCEGNKIPDWLADYNDREIINFLWKAGWDVENNILRRRVITEIV